MMNVVVERLSPERFCHYWPTMREQLGTVAGVWEDFWTLDSIFEMTIHGKFQCWGVGDQQRLELVCWTQVAHYPAGMVLQVFLMFGTGLNKYLPHLDATFEKFARETGCKLIEVSGRMGWKGKLKGIGFRPGTTNVVRAVHEWRMQ